MRSEWRIFTEQERANQGRGVLLRSESTIAHSGEFGAHLEKNSVLLMLRLRVGIRQLHRKPYELSQIPGRTHPSRIEFSATL